MNYEELMKAGWRPEAYQSRADLIAPKVLKKLYAAHGYAKPSIPNPHRETPETDGPASDIPDILIEFDGGARNLDYNDNCSGDGYGSYRITENGFQYGVERADFGPRITSNAAECLTLVRALIRARLLVDPSESTLHIIGDSNNTLLKVKEPRVRSRKVHGSYIAAVSELALALEGWKHITTQWRSRIHSVRLFGH